MKFTVTSGAGVTEVVDCHASAKAALEHVLVLLGRKRRDVRIRDEDGWRRTPADLCRMAAQEVALLPDESGLSLWACLTRPLAHLLPVDRRYLVVTLAQLTNHRRRAPSTAALDGEIAADFLFVKHMRVLGRLAHLFDRDRVEVGEKGFARLTHGRINHSLKQHRVCPEIVGIGGA
jgi:hypothetical protein